LGTQLLNIILPLALTRESLANNEPSELVLLLKERVKLLLMQITQLPTRILVSLLNQLFTVVACILKRHVDLPMCLGEPECAPA
jgi:hypothetical protein